MPINALLNQTITVYNKSSLDKFGRESFGSGSSVKARMEVSRKSRLLPTGDTMTIDAKCFLSSAATVSRGDKVSYDSVDYKVTDIHKAIGGNGAVHHLELELQKWE